MKVIQRDIWLCTDCVVVHETGDASSLDYHYTPREAERKLKEIESGLKALGPHLVSDNTENYGDQYECDECGHIGDAEDFGHKVENEGEIDEERFRECPQCHSYDTHPRDNGRDEFSWRECDCCGTALAGERHRYAILGPDEGEQLAVPPDAAGHGADATPGA